MTNAFPLNRLDSLEFEVLQVKTGCRLWINSFFTAILVMLHCRKVESKQEQFRYCLRVLYTIQTESIAIDFVSAIIRGGCIALNTVGYILV